MIISKKPDGNRTQNKNTYEVILSWIADYYKC